MIAAVSKFIDDAIALGKISEDLWIYSGEDHDKPDKDTLGPSGAFLEKIRKLPRYCHRIQLCN